MPLQVVVVQKIRPNVQAVAQTVAWASAGCKVSATAQTLQDGLVLVRQHKPEILIIELVMHDPKTFALLSLAIRTAPAMKIILFAGQETGAVAGEAIRTGVFDIYSEPMQNNSVLKAVERAVEAINRERRESQQLVALRNRAELLSLLTNDGNDGMVAHEDAVRGTLSFEDFVLLVAQPQRTLEQSRPTPNQIDVDLGQHNLQTVTLVLYDAFVVYAQLTPHAQDWQRDAARVADWLEQCIGIPLRVGISQPGQTRGAFRSRYQQARSALWDITLSDSQRVRSYYQGASELSGEHTTMVHRVLECLIEKAELTEQSADEAAQVIVTLSGRQYSHLRAIVSLYAMALCRKFSCPTDQKAGYAMHEAWFVGNALDVRTCLRRLCTALRASRDIPETGYSLLTRNALWHIRLHAAEGATLTNAALQLHVSANHLSALIKRETGATFHEHVQAVRMELARAMLADPRTSVSEIAQAVGYANYVTFFQVFKRLEHMTPTAYRQQRGRYVTLADSALPSIKAARNRTVPLGTEEA